MSLLLELWPPSLSECVPAIFKHKLMFLYLGLKNFIVNVFSSCRLVEVPVSPALGVSGFGFSQWPCWGLRLPLPQLHPHVGCGSAPSTCRWENACTQKKTEKNSVTSVMILKGSLCPSVRLHVCMYVRFFWQLFIRLTSHLAGVFAEEPRRCSFECEVVLMSCWHIFTFWIHKTIAHLLFMCPVYLWPTVSQLNFI